MIARFILFVITLIDTLFRRSKTDLASPDYILTRRVHCWYTVFNKPFKTVCKWVVPVKLNNINRTGTRAKLTHPSQDDSLADLELWFDGDPKTELSKIKTKCFDLGLYRTHS